MTEHHRTYDGRRDARSPATLPYTIFRDIPSLHHFQGHSGGIMFEDQTIELLPARTTLQTGGAGGRGGRGGDALAVSAAVIAVGGRNSGDLTATSGAATATGGAGGAGGAGGSVTP